MKTNLFLVSLLAGSSLVACGGGGGGSSTPENTTPDTPAPTETTIAQGVVTGFGSVIVNGVHFDVSAASINVDGNSQVESDLGVGQLVRITGSVNADGLHGKATALIGESRLRAPIDSVDLIVDTNTGVATGEIVALGQTILVTADTFYEDGLLATDLKAGDFIKVSAYTNADGDLVATRVELLTGSEIGEVFLSGSVADLNITAKTFTINGVAVDYSKATINDLPNKLLTDGLVVRVHGTVVNGVLVANGNVHLSLHDLKHDGLLDTKHNYGLFGVVSDLVPNTSFVLDSTTVLISNTTVFENGTAASLNEGVWVKVKGSLDAERNLVASKVILYFKPRVHDEGLVQAVDLTAKTLTLNGVTFYVTADTSFNDRSKAHVRLFDLEDLVTGDFVDVRGYKQAATATTPERMIATRVERKNAKDKGHNGYWSEVSGVIESVNGDVIVVSGHNIKVTNKTQLKGFTNIQAFLNGAVGLHVEVKGTVENDVFVARVIELEDEDDEHISSSSKSSSSVATSVASSAASSSSVVSSSSSTATSSTATSSSAATSSSSSSSSI
jgi:hypothetical protein